MKLDIPLTLNGLVVPTAKAERTRAILGCFSHGIALSRTIVDGELRLVLAVREPGGDMILAFLDDDQVDDLAHLIAEEIEAVAADRASDMGAAA